MTGLSAAVQGRKLRGATELVTGCAELSLSTHAGAVAVLLAAAVCIGGVQ